MNQFEKKSTVPFDSLPTTEAPNEVWASVTMFVRIRQPPDRSTIDDRRQQNPQYVRKTLTSRSADDLSSAVIQAATCEIVSRRRTEPEYGQTVPAIGFSLRVALWAMLSWLQEVVRFHCRASQLCEQT